jgi:hypothetical protein
MGKLARRINKNFGAESGIHALGAQAQLSGKAINARNHGAKGVIQVHGKLKADVKLEL